MLEIENALIFPCSDFIPQNPSTPKSTRNYTNKVCYCFTCLLTSASYPVLSQPELVEVLRKTTVAILGLLLLTGNRPALCLPVDLGVSRFPAVLSPNRLHFRSFKRVKVV